MASHRGAAPADELTQALMLVQGWDLIDKTVGHAQNLTDVRQQRAPLHPRPRLRQLPDHATLPQPGAYRHRLRQEETQGRSKIKKPLTSDCAGPFNAPAPGPQTLVSCAAPPTGLPGQRLGQVALAVALILTVSSSNGQAMDRLDRPIRARSQ